MCFVSHRPPPTPPPQLTSIDQSSEAAFVLVTGDLHIAGPSGHLLSWSFVAFQWIWTQLCPPVFLTHLAPLASVTSYTWLFFCSSGFHIHFAFLSVSFHSLQLEDSTASYRFSLLLCLSSEVVSSKLMALNSYALYIWPDTHLEFQVPGLPLFTNKPLKVSISQNSWQTSLLLSSHVLV